MAHIDYTKQPPVLVDDWHIDDVYNQAPWATENQAIEVLEAIAEGFDASIGISWDTFDYYIANICPELRLHNYQKD